jgi:hypothetical protein
MIQFLVHICKLPNQASLAHPIDRSGRNGSFFLKKKIGKKRKKKEEKKH